MSIFKSKKNEKERDSVVCPACTNGKICGQKCDYCDGTGLVTVAQQRAFYTTAMKPSLPEPKLNLHR